ncbi:MAG: hypothetical protein RL745_88 [Actinomycetota bacterium]
MKYMIFVIDVPGNTGNPDEMTAIDAFNDSLEAEGHWVTAAGIAEAGRATVIDNRSDAGVVQTGSIQTTGEHYSGFWIIDAADDEQAHALAMAGSKACNRKVELRPYLR